jgi:hypothetical protein
LRAGLASRLRAKKNFYTGFRRKALSGSSA